MDGKLYLIKKDCRKRDNRDAPWLLNYKLSSMKEFMENGQLQEVYTCLWGSQERDAKLFKNEDEARKAARHIGGCIVVAIRKEEMA